MHDVRKRLKVPLRPQRTSRWCWVAAVQMISEYFGEPVEQCTLVGPDCCREPPPETCLRVGEPAEPLARMGFSYERTELLAALSWDQIVAEIDANRPFIIGWNLPDGVHFMVGVGYQVSNGTRYVLANNPLPVGTGEEYRVTYDWYSNGKPGGTHWHDYYKIVRS